MMDEQKPKIANHHQYTREELGKIAAALNDDAHLAVE